MQARDDGVVDLQLKVEQREVDKCWAYSEGRTILIF